MAFTDFFRRLNRRSTNLVSHDTPESTSYLPSILRSTKPTDWDRKARFSAFNRMMYDTPVVTASVGRFFDFVNASRMDFQASDNDEDGQYARMMNDLIIKSSHEPFESLVSNISSAYMFGSAYSEFSIKINDDNTVGLDRVRPIPVYTLEVPHRKNRRGDIIALRQRQLGYVEPVDIGRQWCVGLRTTNGGLIQVDEGIGIFHHLLEPVEKLRQLIKLEEFAFTRDLQGIIKQKHAFRKIAETINEGVGKKYYEAARTGDQDAHAALQKLYKDAWEKAREPGKAFAKSLNDNKFTILISEESEPHIVMGTDNSERATTVPMSDTTFLETSGGPHDVLLEKIQNVKHDIVAIFETTDIQLGSGRVGTQAVGETKYNIYEIRLNSVLNAVADAIQRDLVIPFCIMNNVPENMYPTITPSIARDADPQRSAGVVKQLYDSGMSIPPEWKGWNDILHDEDLPPIDMERVMEMEQERLDDRQFNQRMQEQAADTGE